MVRVSDDAQAKFAVTSLVEPSLKVAMAFNWVVLPMATVCLRRNDGYGSQLRCRCVGRTFFAGERVGSGQRGVDLGARLIACYDGGGKAGADDRAGHVAIAGRIALRLVWGAPHRYRLYLGSRTDLKGTGIERRSGRGRTSVRGVVDGLVHSAVSQGYRGCAGDRAPCGRDGGSGSRYSAARRPGGVTADRGCSTRRRGSLLVYERLCRRHLSAANDVV